MKRKIFNLSLLVMTVVAMVGCRQVPFSEYSTLADWTWVYSGDYADGDQYELMQISAGENISFMDCSQGYIDHKWIVPTNSGISFLNEEPKGNAEYSDLSFVANPSYVTSDPTIHLYFKDWSEDYYPIRMVNTYNKPVKYLWQMNNINYETSSVYKDGAHVADTTFKVRVYSKYMTPRARIFRARADKGATSIPHGFDPGTLAMEKYGYDENKVYNDDDWKYTYAGEVFFKGIDGVALPFMDSSDSDAASIVYDKEYITDLEVMFGQSLYFVDDSYDTPNYWEWSNIKSNVTYHSIVNSTEAEMQFVTLTEMKDDVPQAATTFDAIKLKVERTSEDEIMPTSKAKTVTLPISVIVNGSAYEPELTAELINGNIQLTVSNAAFDMTDYGNLWDSSNFFAMYENSYDDSEYSGVDYSTNKQTGLVTFSTADIIVDAATPHIMTLTPDSPLYNTDEIRLFWNTSLMITNNEMTSIDPNNGSYSSTGGYQEAAFTNGEGQLLDTASQRVEHDFYYDFDSESRPDYSAGDIQWTLIKADLINNTGVRASVQPEFVDDPMGTRTGKVLKVTVPKLTSDEIVTKVSYYMIAGRKFKGIGSKTIDFKFDFYCTSKKSTDAAFDYTKHCDHYTTPGKNPSCFYKIIVPGVVTDLDPANNKYDFDFDFRDDSEEGVGSSLGNMVPGWLYHLNDKLWVNNGHYFLNVQPGTYGKTWTPFLEQFGHGFYDCADGEEIFMAVDLQCYGTFYMDNMSFRTVDIRPENN